ncbi:TetR/AcrR family transcriptional regulator [Amycolatopsis australiensis]|uniref:DNA-binding transcriptional regulator, AcrR family n=1 Tax=Amycolatopsis australiensis TaxID=546364 RepID=A0A1K1S5G8_9PSEU|nr:TetR/AcrR family transcriptional regulator [Amycolatopsis australiensis]SFW79319.1 DNA-binding transcriptional regulator, AcrR family [Amycolatopsis australiensis]
MLNTESLRERRKRELRAQLSATATRMFLEHGFEAVRVADVARACGVAEKTVFNHFGSKEALVADRWDVQVGALVARLADPSVAPLDAALEVLEAELGYLVASARERSWAEIRRFGELVRSTPALVAHYREARDRLTEAAAAALSSRTGAERGDPEVCVTAAAIAGLWNVYALSLQKHMTKSGPHVARAVRADLAAAADALRRGL